MVLAFQEQNAIRALRFGVKMETVQALIIKNKQADLMGQHARAAEKEK